MQQILVIAKQTFKEAVRNKKVFILITLGVVTICCSVFMPVVGDGREKIKIVESMCFRSITFFGTLVAILLSASSIPTDIDNKVLCTITAKPVQRANIVFGKIIGFAYIIGVLLLIMGSVSYAFLRGRFGCNYLKGLTIISTQFLLMVVIAVLGSTFLSLPVNILFCLFILFCGSITNFMRDLSTVINVIETREHEHGISEVMQKSNVYLVYLNNIIKKPILLLRYILPDFSVGKYFVDGINIPCKRIFMGFGYAVLYALVCLPISFLVFKRKEIA